MNQNTENSSPTSAGTGGDALDKYALSDNEVYLSERSSLIKRRDELGDIFDKGRVALAGGAVALTVTISKDLIGSMVTWERVALAGGWIVLTASLICAVLAVYTAGLAYDRQIDILDDDRRAYVDTAKGDSRDRTNPRAATLERLNAASIWLLAFGLFISGIGLFNAFARGGKPVVASSTASTTIVRNEYIHNEEKQMSNPNDPKTKGASHEQKSFGPKDRPVTPKAPSDSNNSGQQAQNGGEKQK